MDRPDCDGCTELFDFCGATYTDSFGDCMENWLFNSSEGQAYLEEKGYVKKEQDKQDKFEEKYLPFKRKNRR